MSPRIRDMTEGDLEVVATLHVESFPSDRKMTRDVADAQLREELARAWSYVRVAEADGAVAAFSLVWRVVDELHLLNVAVAPAARRRGLGEALMLDMLEIGRTAGTRTIFLEVRRSNEPAIGLYRKLGFWASGLRLGYYDDGEDALEMMLSLDPSGLVVPHEDEVAL